jgi:hypothetical protein
MMHPLLAPPLRILALVLACSATCISARADTDPDAAVLNETAQVAGKHLRLNGAGISFHLFFKVYAMGLYLLDHRSTVEDVLASNGPRRLFIALLRDVSGGDFEERVLHSVSGEGNTTPAEIAARMLQLAKTISAQPQGLRKGDTLTLDWVPGTGTVIELNRKRLADPVPDIAFYNALLNIWIGDKPTDPALKAKLLGGSVPMRTVMN